MLTTTQGKNLILAILVLGVSLHLAAGAFGEHLHAAEFEPPYALEFDGSADYLSIGHDEAFDMTDEITVEAWFLQGAVKSDYHMLIHKSPTNNAWLLLNNQRAGASGDRIGWRWYDGQNFINVEAAGLNENEWYHVAGVHDGSEGKLYLNGELADSAEAPFEPVTGEGLQIGAGGSSPDTSYFWNGAIAAVRIHDRALSGDEIAENMYKSLSGDEEGLVGYWPLNEEEGDTAYDKSAGENHGEISGAEWGIALKPTEILAEPPERVLPVLIEIAEEHSSAGMRRQAVSGLAMLELGAEEIMPVLLGILEDVEDAKEVRMVALDVLLESDVKEEGELVPVLLSILENPDETDVIRKEVLDVLIDLDMAAEDLAPVLVEIAANGEESYDIRMAILRGIKAAGPHIQERVAQEDNALDTLSKVAREKGQRLPIRAAANSALAELSPEAAEKLSWSEPELGPPMNPEAWHRVPGEVLREEDVWGKRIDPRSTFDLPGGRMGLFYTGRPHEEVRFDDERVERLAEEGRVPAEVGNIAITRDLICWMDYPDNPVMDEVQHDWQKGIRTLLMDVVYDPVERRWVAYFSDRNGEYTGIRGVGVAYSNDLINWEYHHEPVLAIDVYISHVPGAELTDALEQQGRVYLAWAFYFEDRFYIALSGTDRVGENRSYGMLVLSAENPTGPFEYVAYESDIGSGHYSARWSKPVHHAGRWYKPYTDTWNGQPGIGLKAADAPWGPYKRKTKEAPVVEVSTTERKGPLLFRHDGVWGVLFTTGGHWSGHLTLQMAVADISPELLMLECNDESD